MKICALSYFFTCVFLNWPRRGIVNSRVGCYSFFHFAEFGYSEKLKYKKSFRALSTNVADKITRNYRRLYSRIVHHAMFGFMALYVVAGRLSIYQNAVPVAFRERMAVRNNRKLRSANKWTESRERNGKITMEGNVGCSGIPSLLSVDSWKMRADFP